MICSAFIKESIIIELNYADTDKFRIQIDKNLTAFIPLYSN